MGSWIASIRASIQDKVAGRKLPKQEEEHDDNVLNSRSKKAQALMPSETRAKVHHWQLRWAFPSTASLP